MGEPCSRDEDPRGAPHLMRPPRRRAAAGASQGELKAAGISRSQSRARAAAGLPPVGSGLHLHERSLFRRFDLILERIRGGTDYLSILPAVLDAITLSPTDLGRVLREGGRIVYDSGDPLQYPEGVDSGVFPSDDAFPLPLPAIPILPARGRSRDRARGRRQHCQVLSLAVAASNCSFFCEDATRAIPPMGCLPASSSGDVWSRCLLEFLTP